MTLDKYGFVLALIGCGIIFLFLSCRVIDFVATYAVWGGFLALCAGLLMLLIHAIYGK